jgi:hypothetical protein
MTSRLLKQRDMFTRRYRTVPALNPSELQIQISLVARLKLELRSDVVMFHCPNGEWRDKRTAAKLKAMGVLPGVADLIFIWNYSRDSRPLVLFLELKSSGKKPTDTQFLFETRVKACGAFYEWTDNIDDAHRIVKEYGLLK